MTLKKSNKLLRFAFLGNRHGIPQQISVCVLFWRAVGTVMVLGFAAFFGVMVLWAVGFVGYGLFKFTVRFPALATTMYVSIVAAVLLAKSRLLKTAPLQLTAEFIRAKKQKFCLIVEITE